MYPFLLHSEDLLSKFGFGDGDMLENWWETYASGPMYAAFHMVEQLVEQAKKEAA
jgi:hypothetical protein